MLILGTRLQQHLCQSYNIVLLFLWWSGHALQGWELAVGVWSGVGRVLEAGSAALSVLGPGARCSHRWTPSPPPQSDLDQRPSLMRLLREENKASQHRSLAQMPAAPCPTWISILPRAKLSAHPDPELRESSAWLFFTLLLSLLLQRL